MATVFNCSECGFLAVQRYELEDYFASTGHRNKSLIARVLSIFRR